MNESRFRFLIVAICITIMASIALWRFSDPKLYTPDQPQQKEKSLGQYIYLDYYKILHTDRKCSRLNYKGMTSSRYLTKEFPNISYEDLCPKCVNDSQFDELHSL